MTSLKKIELNARLQSVLEMHKKFKLILCQASRIRSGRNAR